MPTPAELVLALITDVPLSREDRRAIALLILQLARRIREGQGPVSGAGP